MGILGSLLGGGGQQQGIVQALIDHISGSGGVQGVIDRFRGSGLGNKADSWVSTGQNEEVSGDEVERGLGSDTVNEIANRAGLPSGMASGAIAALLPMVIDHLTPNGQVPDQNSLASMAQGLISRFKKTA